MGWFNGGDRKKSALKQATTASTMRDQMGKDYANQRGELAGFRGTISGARTAPRPDVEKLRSSFSGMIDDPSKRGWSADTINKMHTRSADIGTGQKTSFMRNIGKNIAARGMGNTGAGIRSLQEFDEGQDARSRTAAREVDIGAAEAGRSDLWNAMSGLSDVQRGEDAFQGNMLGMEGNTLNAIGDTYGDQAQGQLATFAPEANAYETAYKPGFWGNLGSSLASSLGQSIGSGFGTFGMPLGQAGAAGGFQNPFKKKNPGWSAVNPN
jgi:hypothetical protein